MSNLQWFFMPILGYKKNNSENIDIRRTLGPYDSESELTAAMKKYITRRDGEIGYHDTGDFLIYQGRIKSFEILSIFNIEEKK